MLRSLLLALAGFAATLPLAAHAQGAAGFYVAVPSAKPVKPVLITRATPWRLQGDAYVAERAAERDQVLCELVAKSVGPLASFTVAGKPYDADRLAKCNTHAKA